MALSALLQIGQTLDADGFRWQQCNAQDCSICISIMNSYAVHCLLPAHWNHSICCLLVL